MLGIVHRHSVYPEPCLGGRIDAFFGLFQGLEEEPGVIDSHRMQGSLLQGYAQQNMHRNIHISIEAS